MEFYSVVARVVAQVVGPLTLAVLSACASGSMRTPPRADVPAASANAAPERDYLLYVGSEATDRIALIRFGPGGARIEKEIMVGMMPADPDGPHGIAVSPDGRYWYTTTAHGTPFGHLWKYATGTDSLVGRVMLGSFPATMQLTPDGAFVYVVNFNLHGEMVPSSVSIVAADEMLEVARVQTCTMPHGSRLNAAGTKHYSACMMDDLAVEIDTRTFAVSRRFALGQGHHAAVGCSPTWAQPSADGGRLFVACNKSSEIAEIDLAMGTISRRIPAGPGVYNLATTRDGTRLIATNKRGQSVSIIDVATGKELARIATKRPVVHGVVVSPDDRYAFASVEGVGSEPGTVEIIDLAALRSVATVDVGQMAGGIDFWRMEPAR